jgi:hypothetical protein
MNKFITNPHWINPGEEITLLEYREKKIEKPKPEPVKKIAPIAKPKKPPAIKPSGMDISSLTNIKDLGFLGKEETKAWGQIFDIKTEKIMVSKNDTVYAKIYKNDVKPGDMFTVYSVSGPIKHPVTGNKCGYIHSFKGTIEIEEALKDYYAAKIKESFRAIHKDDLLMPYRPVSSCITPVPYNGNIAAHIVSSKDELDLLAQYSIVYIDAGFHEKVYRGNIFEIVEERESKSPTKETVLLPPVVLGKVLILDTTEDTSAGVVFWSSKDFSNGAKIRACNWDKLPKELAHLPRCPIK